MNHYLTGCRRQCSQWLGVMPVSEYPAPSAGPASYGHMLCQSHGEHILCSFPGESPVRWCGGTSQTFQNDQYLQQPVPELRELFF